MFGVLVVVREIWGVWALFVLLEEALFRRGVGFLHKYVPFVFRPYIGQYAELLDTRRVDGSHEQGEERSMPLVLFCEPYKGVALNAFQGNRTVC